MKRHFLTGLSEIRKGGSYQRFVRMLRALAERGHRVHVLSTSEEPFMDLHVRWHPMGTSLPPRMKPYVFFLLFPFYCAYHVLFSNVRGLIAFGPLYALFMAPARLLGQCHMICMVRGMLSDEYGYQGRSKFTKWAVSALEKVGFSVSDKILVVSKTLGRTITERYGVDPDKISHLPNEIPRLQEAEDSDETHGEAIWRERLPGGGLRILAAGVITRIKNFEEIIDAISRLSGPFHLCIAGSPFYDVDKTYLNYLRNQVKRKDMENHVSWLGWQPHEALLGLLKASHLLVSASRHEGMPNIVLEALSLGIPCLAKRTPEALELLLSRELTFETPGELAEMIEKFYESASFGKNVSHLCDQARAHWTFNWEERLIQCLESEGRLD